MRLERLEIAGFGCLRDVTVEFHPRVTVILGENESGKSTVHRAVRAALYGLDAGGQGRAVERSDWARWTPWTSGPYGIALLYVLDDGRPLRVARGLDSREQRVQVLELGGPDLTDELRHRRAVIPGLFHLGVDEAVFCATAWLGEDGLRLASPEAVPQRAEQLQEAIERLADTREGTTATQATARLREAIDRVGSERRLSSELGSATVRLRELDFQLEEARRRLSAVAGEQERLRDLEARAAVEAQRQAIAEHVLLGTRLAEIRERRRLLHMARLEATELATVVAETDEQASFPVDAEARVTTIGGEVARATITAAEAQTRWDTAKEQLRPARRRRAEIAAGLAAMADTGAVDPDVAERSQRLRGELTALELATHGSMAGTVADARAEALRREIAATGLRSVPPQSADELLDLLAEQRSRAPQWAAGALLVAVVGAAGTAVMAAAHRGLLGALIACLAAVVAVAMAYIALRRRSVARRARARVAALAAQAGLEHRELERLSRRLPVLQVLTTALAHEQAGLAGRRAEADAVRASTSALVQRCAELANSVGVAPATVGAAATAPAALSKVRDVLDTVDDVVAAQLRRAQLEAEDAQLAAQERSFHHIADHSHRAADVVSALERHLEQELTKAGLPASRSPSEAVTTFRAACDARRRHDGALRALGDLDQRIRALGDDSVLRQQEDDLILELRARGGADTLSSAALPFDAEALRRLDLDAAHARQAAHSVSEQARELRARLEGVLDTLPDIADLEDERDACAAARERGLRRLAALRSAIELIERASRGTHRELAPRLAASVASRLALLTDSRYLNVNVDTEHFAISLLAHERPDMVPAELTSHGTRDQVSLLLRLALCECLSTSGERIPISLDEPLLTADPRRRELLLEFLYRLSETHQVVLTASDPEIAAMVSRVSGGDCSVVTLGRARTPERERLRLAAS